MICPTDTILLLSFVFVSLSPYFYILSVFVHLFCSIVSSYSEGLCACVLSHSIQNVWLFISSSKCVNVCAYPWLSSVNWCSIREQDIMYPVEGLNIRMHMQLINWKHTHIQTQRIQWNVLNNVFSQITGRLKETTDEHASNKSLVVFHHLIFSFPENPNIWPFNAAVIQIPGFRIWNMVCNLIRAWLSQG